MILKDAGVGWKTFDKVVLTNFQCFDCGRFFPKIKPSGFVCICRFMTRRQKGGLPYVLYRNTVSQAIKDEVTGLYRTKIKSELHFCHTCTTSHPEFKFGRTKDGDVSLQDGTTLLYTNRGFSPAPSQYYENRTEEQKEMWLKYQHESPHKLDLLNFGKKNGDFFSREEGKEGPSSVIVQPGQVATYVVSQCIHGSPMCENCFEGKDPFEGECPFCGGAWKTRDERKVKSMAKQELPCPVCMDEKKSDIEVELETRVVMTTVLNVPQSSPSGVVSSLPSIAEERGRSRRRHDEVIPCVVCHNCFPRSEYLLSQNTACMICTLAERGSKENP